MNSFSKKSMVLLFTLSLLVSCGGGGGGGGGTSSSGLPDLAVTAFSAPSSGTAGGSYTVTGTITNQGGSLAAGASAIIYLSPNNNVATDGGQVGLDIYVALLDVGQSWNFSIPVTLPTNIADGSYYIGVVTLYGDEADKSNNTRSRAITITGGTTCVPDWYESDNSFGTSKPLAFGVSQQHNHCEGTSDWMSFSATAGQAYGFLAAKVGNKAAPSLSLYGTDGSSLLGSSSSALWSLASRMTWTAPTSGTYYVKAFPSMGTFSSGANTEYLITVGGQRPDLIVSNFSASSTGLPGGIIYAYDTVRNQGFAATTSNFDVSVYISSSSVVTAGSGTWIGTRTVTSPLAVDQSNNSPTLNYTLPASLPTGTYYLAAIANTTNAVSEVTTGNNTSSISQIFVQPLGSCSPDQYEQDDSAGSASIITVGAAPQAHNHCDDTADWLKFDAVSGNSYAVRVTRSGLSSAWVELYGGGGTNLLAGDGTNETIAIDWQAPSSGTYYLKVGANGSGAGTDYTVQVQPKLPDLVQTLTLSNGNTVYAGGYLNVTDAVSNIGYKDAGPFEIGFYYSQNANVTTADQLGTVRSVSGLPAGGGWQSTDQSWANYVHFPVSLQTGTYYLAAIADRNNAVPELSETNNASTSLAVSVIAPPCAVDSYEDDDDPSTAKTILAGQTQSRNFCDDGVDWIRFTTPSVDGYYVAADPAQLGTLEVYQSDGTTMVTPHDTYFYSKLSWYGTANTTYYLKYYTYQGTTGGAYQLSVFQCTPDAYEPDDTLATAQTISVGETQTRNHCEDRYDYAKFTAVQGTSYTITATNGQNVYTSLYDGVSEYALASGQSAQGGKLKVMNWTAPASGTYYIEVSRFEFGQNTDYTLNLK